MDLRALLRRIDWPVAIFLVAYHLAVIVALPIYFAHNTPATGVVVAALVLLLVTEIGIGAAYHRFYSHRCYKMNKAAEAVLLSDGFAPPLPEGEADVPDRTERVRPDLIDRSPFFAQEQNPASAKVERGSPPGGGGERDSALFRPLPVPVLQGREVRKGDRPGAPWLERPGARPATGPLSAGADVVDAVVCEPLQPRAERVAGLGEDGESAHGENPAAARPVLRAEPQVLVQPDISPPDADDAAALRACGRLMVSALNLAPFRSAQRYAPPPSPSNTGWPSRHPIPRMSGYPRAHDSSLQGSSTMRLVHNDGEIYAAAMWRVLELHRAKGLTADDLMADFVDGMNYTPATPPFEKMRDGMLQSIAATSDTTTAARRCAVWTGFAEQGIGQGATGTVSRRGTVTVVESFTVPVGVCP